MSHECAFPQPITPSGYELNETNKGLTKREWLAYKLFISEWKQSMSASNVALLAEACLEAADVMLKKT